MLKTKYKIGLGLLMTAATSLCACGKKDTGKVVFWSSFGSTYGAVLGAIVNKVVQENGFEVEHESQGDYKQIYSNMTAAIGNEDYPNLAIGYPDHFASYLGSGILEPLDDYFSEDELKDYYPNYMTENKFYDNGQSNAKERIYGIPFNKSTELMGYNGVFVDYAATFYPELAEVPKTWQEWQTKGPLYNECYEKLYGKGLYGVQDVFGNATELEALSPVNGELPGTVDANGDLVKDGKTLLLDCVNVSKANSVLLGWDAADNAFITLVRQWGVTYTKVDPSENTKLAKRRIGSVMFNSEENQPTVIEMLKFFRKLYKDHIFGTPQTPFGKDYCSKVYPTNQVMFMICSSGGLSHTVEDFKHRFRVAPIPYNAAPGGSKSVISQGANICMTNQGAFENSVKTIKALTTGKFQTEWCLQTGYYPCSVSATQSPEYQNFIHEDMKYENNQWVKMDAAEAEAAGAFARPIRVAYREGSRLNEEEYMNASKAWDKFVDPAFEGSSVLREAVGKILDAILSIPEDKIEQDSLYKEKLDGVEEDSTIKGKSTIQFVH